MSRASGPVNSDVPLGTASAAPLFPEVTFPSEPQSSVVSLLDKRDICDVTQVPFPVSAQVWIGKLAVVRIVYLWCYGWLGNRGCVNVGYREGKKRKMLSFVQVNS